MSSQMWNCAALSVFVYVTSKICLRYCKWGPLCSLSVWTVSLETDCCLLVATTSPIAFTTGNLKEEIQLVKSPSRRWLGYATSVKTAERINVSILSRWLFFKTGCRRDNIVPQRDPHMWGRSLIYMPPYQCAAAERHMKAELKYLWSFLWQCCSTRDQSWSRTNRT